MVIVVDLAVEAELVDLAVDLAVDFAEDLAVDPAVDSELAALVCRRLGQALPVLPVLRSVC